MADELVDCLAILVVVRRLSSLGAADSCSLRSESYTRMKKFVKRSTSVTFRRFLEGVGREFMQCLYVVLHGTFDSYLRDPLHEGGVSDVACIPSPRAKALPPPYSPLLVVDSNLFCNK
jgi:predicted pyridoxine 5'-phosphate oxidase superfamily flavin-nucleotide-binding protein